jgi:hypothetical protein
MAHQGDRYMDRVAAPDTGKSTFFPVFNVNVPMPSGTAMPASAPPGAQSAGIAVDSAQPGTTQST